MQPCNAHFTKRNPYALLVLPLLQTYYTLYYYRIFIIKTTRIFVLHVELNSLQFCMHVNRYNRCHQYTHKCVKPATTLANRCIYMHVDSAMILYNYSYSIVKSFRSTICTQLFQNDGSVKGSVPYFMLYLNLHGQNFNVSIDIAEPESRSKSR